MSSFGRVLKATTVAALIITVQICTMPPADAAGAFTVATRSGCSSYWMFNGIWRVRVSDATPYLDRGSHAQIGWQVNEQWRNGTTQTITPTDSSVLSQQLVLQNGQTIVAQDTTTGTLSEQQVDFHQFPPSAQFAHAQIFVMPNVDANNKPVAVIIAFDAGKLKQYSNKPQFTVSPPNYRVRLNCSPDEVARAAAAQGGSVEVAAHEGCLNQWLSNGVWRVRVSNLEPYTHDNQQVGWQLTEDWVNLTSHTTAPGFTTLQDQQLALKSEDTVSSGNSTLTTLTSQKLTFHDFAPGGSFKHTQPFWPNPPFESANTPSKLLIMFDAKREAQNSTAPQFSGPANIRVNLGCSK